MRSLVQAASVPACAVLVAGCGTLSDCGGDWYDVGQRDGRVGTFAQPDLYARRCPAVDVERYNAGYRAGISGRPNLGGM